VSRYPVTLAFAAFAGALWLLYGISEDYRIFGGVSTTHVLLWAAWLTTGLLLALVLGRLILVLGFALFDHEATGLQRGIVYSVLTFVLVSVVLASLGVNIATILTTSVVTTAIVGLAMQPTLSGLIAGSTLELGRELHIGDVILLNDEPIEVVSLNWRSVAGRKEDGTVVVVPNARIAESRIDILPANKPARVDVVMPVPLAVAPHRIGEMVSEAIYDLPYADPALPVRIEPLAFRTLEGAASCRVEYWTPHGRDLIRARQALLERLWYIYQREQIAWPVPTFIISMPAAAQLPAVEQLKAVRLDGLDAAKLPALTSAVLAPELSLTLATSVIAGCGPPLCYGDGELIVMSRSVERFSLFMLVEGALREAPVFALRGDAAIEAGRRLTTLSQRMMAIERIAAELAQHIGPYAEYAVREAAAADLHPPAVCATVAQEIEDPAERERFVSALRFDDQEVRGPGFVFGLQSGAYARVSSPSMRAVGGAVIVPIVLEEGERRGE
jgi:small-conductance mechanosensitive channel